jgi:hypothetical protein
MPIAAVLQLAICRSGFLPKSAAEFSIQQITGKAGSPSNRRCFPNERFQEERTLSRKFGKFSISKALSLARHDSQVSGP